MDKIYQAIHDAIHDIAKPNFVDTPIGKLPIKVYRNGCRYVDFQGTRIMAQNPATSSDYARRARAGECLSWAMHKEKAWELITNSIT